jgi:hypothetical protein
MRAATKGALLAKLLLRHLRLPDAAQGTLLCQGRRVSVAAPRAARDDLELCPGLLPVLRRGSGREGTPGVAPPAAAERGRREGPLARIRRRASGCCCAAGGDTEAGTDPAGPPP